MQIELSDGVSLFVHEVGEGFPVIVLHGGPGLDHTHMSPWLDPLADEFRLLYVDERGQGRSDRVDPASLSLDSFANDVDLLADALGLDGFALLGHSFGAIVATRHAIERGTAAGYVISGGGDSSDAMLADVEASLQAMGNGAEAIAESWEHEKTVENDEEPRQLLDSQMPFHFHGEPPPGFSDRMVGSPEVLRHFANQGYGDFDYVPQLGRVSKPTLVIVGEQDRHEGITGSELAVVPEAGHMSFVEQPEAYFGPVRRFFRRVAA